MAEKTINQQNQKLNMGTGDKGLTTLVPGAMVSKADERVNAMGSVEEAIAHLGLAMVATSCPIFRGKIERIQKTLKTLVAGIADSRSGQFVFSAEEIEFLEEDMADMRSKLPEGAMQTLPGGCEQSARLDAARAAVRRAERELVAMDKRYSAKETSKRYLNRLGDYLLVAARYSDLLHTKSEKKAAKAAVPAAVAQPEAQRTVESVVAEVLSQMGGTALGLDRAVSLITAIEMEARRQGKQIAVAVVNAQGNPIAMHVMDGAFLVSYEVAMKKAYTAVAVKMPTIELSKLVQPGETFYGLQNMDKIITFGGGVPLKAGSTVIGGLGVSGGTGEEDHALCEYGLSVFENL